MSDRTLVGYFIRRTWKDCPPGKTLVAESHRIYPTRDKAEQAIVQKSAYGKLDERFTYDVAEAYMTVEKEVEG